MEITLKNVKTNRAMSDETPAFSASVYVKRETDDPRALANPKYVGVKVGAVINRGHGGSHIYRWDDPAIGREVERWANDQTIIIPADEFSEEYELDFEKLDHFIYAALDEWETKQWFKRQCAKKTLFRLKEDRDPDSWRILNRPYTPLVMALLVKNFGRDIAEVANETRV